MKKNLSKDSLRYTYLLALIIIYTSCSNNENGEDEKIIKTPSQNYKPQILKDTIGGVYHEYYKNGNVKIKGVFINGKRDGDWSYFYENGKLWSWGEYTQGLRNGISNVYYENGVLKMEGNYVNDQQIGLWKFYDETGKLTKEIKLK